MPLLIGVTLVFELNGFWFDHFVLPSGAWTWDAQVTATGCADYCTHQKLVEVLREKTMFPQKPCTGDQTFPKTDAATLEQVIAEKAERRLCNQSHRALKNIRCNWADGVLTLHGCLPTHYLKQIAQAVVAGTEGIARIDNRIEVIGPAPGVRDGMD